MLVTQKADDITQVEDRSKMKLQHFHLSIVKDGWIGKRDFFTFSKHAATYLEISARAYSARQSMHMQKLNIFHIYIALIA